VPSILHTTEVTAKKNKAMQDHSEVQKRGPFGHERGKEKEVSKLTEPTRGVAQASSEREKEDSMPEWTSFRSFTGTVKLSRREEHKGIVTSTNKAHAGKDALQRISATMEERLHSCLKKGFSTSPERGKEPGRACAVEATALY